MLVGLICDCGNSETIFRSAMQRCGKSNYMTARVFHGKSGMEAFIGSLPENIQQLDETQLLRQYINNRGKFVIAVGYNDRTLVWGDLADGITGKTRAEIVIDKFD